MSDFLLISALAELSSGKGFGFNSNFLEANVINMALLLSGVFYLGQNFLARTVKETILAQGKLDIERLTNNGKSSIEKAELQIKKQIQQRITDLALKRVSTQLQDYMTPSLQSKVIDNNIAQLGGQL